MSYLDNLYSPPAEIANEGFIEFNYKPQKISWKDKLKHTAAKIGLGAAAVGLAGYGLHRAGKNNQNVKDLVSAGKQVGSGLAKGGKAFGNLSKPAVSTGLGHLSKLANYASNKLKEEALDPRFTGGKSMVDGYNTFSALGYKRPENLKKLDNKLFGKRDDTEPVVTGWFGNPSQYNNG